MMKHIAAGMICIATMILGATATAAPVDWRLVDQAIGRKGAEQPGGVHKYSFPRSDLHITLDGVALRPALALGGWTAFESSGSEAMCMGDLVLLDTEVSPVMERLIEGGFEITALHNHLSRTSQPIFYMHVEGHGNPVRLAQALHAALALSHTPLSPPPPASVQPIDLDTAAISRTLGERGKVNGGVLQFSFPRAEMISEHGMPIPAAMGTATGINFEPTGGGKAAITGDFVLIGSEVNPVLKALRENGIEVTALHSHMIGESPRLFFMHFWANDDAQRLARGLRGALDRARVKHGS
jgi:hypothetical protein